MEKNIYIKYSNERKDIFKLRTNIIEDSRGKRIVQKVPLTVTAQTHIRNIERYYHLLKQNYDETYIDFNKVHINDGVLECEYLNGKTLEEYLDELLVKKQYDIFHKVIKQYIERVISPKEIIIFNSTEEFEIVFGSVKLPENLKAAKISNIDSIFANIIMTDRWNVIDYEWTFEFPVPLNYIIYRAVFYYINGFEKRHIAMGDNIYELCGITKEETIAYEIMERNFQKYIIGDEVPGWRLYSHIRGDNYNIHELIRNQVAEKKQYEVQIFYDYGLGMSEKDSIVISPIIDEKGNVCFKVPIVNKDLKVIRIDPTSCYCIVNIVNISKADFYTNGIGIDERNIVFLTDDPQIIINNMNLEDDFIEIVLKVLILPKEIVERIGENILEQRGIMEEMGSKIKNIEKEYWSLKEDITNVQQKNDNLYKEKCVLEETNKYLQQEKVTLENVQQEIRVQLEENNKVVEYQSLEIESNKKVINNLLAENKNKEIHINELLEENKNKEILIREMENTKVWKMYRIYRKMRGDR